MHGRLLGRCLVAIAVCAIARPGACLADEVPERPNILFILCDDLNHVDLGPAHTPNMDRLLAVSTEFRGYANFPWCNPSRASLFSGLRPEALGFYDNDPKPKLAFPDRYWLSRGIYDAGYYTAGVGKVLHRGNSAYNVTGWSEFLYPANHNPSLATATVIPYGDGTQVAYWEDDVSMRDVPHKDGALELLARARNQEAPWCVMVGFKKPHLPLYSNKIDWLANGFLHEDGTANPDSLADLDMNPERPVKNYPAELPFEPRVSLEQAKLFRMGYRACISHVDRLLGEVLEAVDTDPADSALNLPPDLMVIFASDHGFATYQLGTRSYAKTSPHETANRMPLWIHLPGQTEHVNRRHILVELVDLYPTLLDFVQSPDYLAGQLMHHGQSLKPHLLSGDWSGWSNWASAVVARQSIPELRCRRVATPELTATHLLAGDRALLFANEEYLWTDPESDDAVSFSADPEHWCNLTQEPEHPLVRRLHDLHRPRALSPPVMVSREAAVPPGVLVEFFGERGLRYTISRSPDLVSWVEAEMVDGAGVEVRRRYDSGAEREFVRVRLWTDPLEDFSFMK